jgi:hypothetical protein
MTTYSPATIESMRAKAVHPDPESRAGKIVELVRKQVGAPTLPTWEQVFGSHFRYGLNAVTLDKMAVFNDSANWDGSNTVLGRAMRDIAEQFGGDNVLNPHAEVDPRRVIAVLGKIIAMRRLYNPIKAFAVSNLDSKSKKRAGVAEYQVFDGRNRAVALALLFGPQVRIPMWIDEEDKTAATVATLEANNVRPTRNMEKVAVQGVEMQAAQATPAAAFASLGENGKRIARWVVGQTSVLKTRVFTKTTFPVSERVKKDSYAVPITGYQEFIKHAIRSFKKDSLKSLDPFAAQMNPVLLGLNTLFDEIKAQDKTGNLHHYWTAYTAPTFGNLLADAIIVGGQKPEAAGKAVAKMAVAYLKANGPDNFNRMPPSRLTDDLKDFSA